MRGKQTGKERRRAGRERERCEDSEGVGEWKERWSEGEGSGREGVEERGVT